MYRWGIAIALGAVAFGLLLGGLVVAAAVLAAIALLFLLLWLISFLWDMANQDTGDPVPDWGDSEEGSGDGPQGGDGDEPPAGGSGGPDPTSQDAPPGTTNVGSPTGRDVVSFDVRFVDMLHEADVRTGFPSERPASTRTGSAGSEEIAGPRFRCNEGPNFLVLAWSAGPRSGAAAARTHGRARNPGPAARRKMGEVRIWTSTSWDRLGVC